MVLEENQLTDFAQQKRRQTYFALSTHTLFAGTSGGPPFQQVQYQLFQLSTVWRLPNFLYSYLAPFKKPSCSGVEACYNLTQVPSYLRFQVSGKRAGLHPTQIPGHPCMHLCLQKMPMFWEGFPYCTYLAPGLTATYSLTTIIYPAPKLQNIMRVIQLKIIHILLLAMYTKYMQSGSRNVADLQT